MAHLLMCRKFRSGRSPTLQTVHDATKIFGSAGALPQNCSLLATRYSQLATHQSLPFNQSPIASRYSPPFWLGRNFALPFCPLTLSRCLWKRSLLKQANLKSCELRVKRSEKNPSRKFLTLNSQPATLSSDVGFSLL